MRFSRSALALFAALYMLGAPALADSVTVTTGPDGTVTSSKPCRVVTCRGNECPAGSNSTTITSGKDGLSGSTTISPGGSSATAGAGGSSSSVVVGSGSSSAGSQSSSAAGGECVIYRQIK